MTALAKDVMQTEVVTIDAGRPLAELEEVLLRHRLHGLPVLDGDRLVGIVSRSDVVRQLKLEEERLAGSAFYLEPFDADERRDEDQSRVLEAAASRIAKLRVRDVMIDHMISVSPRAPVDEVARVMLEQRIHRVLVEEDGVLRGIVSSFDLVRLVAEGRVGSP